MRSDPVKLVLWMWLGAVVLFMLAPTLFVVLNSFNSSPYSRFPPEGFSLRWYQAALSNPNFLNGFQRSIAVAAGAMAVSLIVGALAAVGLVRYRFRGRSLMQAALVSPMVLPKIALGLAMFILFLRLLDALHLKERLAGPFPLMLLHAVIGLPIVVVIISATLHGVDPAIEEAAADLGAGPIRAFLLVTLPQVIHGIITAGVFAFIFSFDEIEAALFMSPLTGNTLPVEMFLFIEAQNDPTLAALSSLLVLLALSLSMLAAWRFGFERMIRLA